LDEIGNAELGDCADRAAEGGAGQDAGEIFGFLLGQKSASNTAGGYHTLKHNRKSLSRVADHSDTIIGCTVVTREPLQSR
jgi:hypothetical protein